MSTFPTLLARIVVAKAGRGKNTRLVRRSPLCESLEGRQLLNGAWSQGLSAGQILGAPAHFHHIIATSTSGSTNEFLGFGNHQGGPGFGPGNLSAQAKADIATLQADSKSLQAEIPVSLTATMQADKAIIEKALGTTAPPMHGKGALGDPIPFSSDFNITDGLKTALQKAGVSATQIDTLVADAATIKSTIASLDPTLSAKITADQAAVQKDLGSNHGMPGGPRFGPGKMSAQAKADFATLQADTKALQAEVPASLTATMQADKAIIDQALSKLAPIDHAKGPHADLMNTTPGNDPTSGITALLQKAGVSSAQINTIVTDMQTYKTTLAGLDPTLTAKITADQAALQKDLGTNHPMPMGGPGLFGPML